MASLKKTQPKTGVTFRVGNAFDPTPTQDLGNGNSIVAQPISGITSPAGFRTLTGHASSRPLPWIGGKQPIGGMFVWGKSNVGGNLLLVFYICRGPINKVVDITFNGISYLGLGITATIYTGTLTQTVDATWSTQLPSHTSGLPGFAYAVLQFPNATGATAAYDPMKPVFLIEGRLVRDPRLDPTLVTRYYSTNAALLTADFQTEKLGGAGAADSAMDWSGAITDAANDCDGGTTRPIPPSLGLAAAGSATAGALATGQFYYTFTFVVSGVESLESPATGFYNASNPSADLSGIVAGPGGTTARKIYRTKVGTGASGARLLVGTIANNVTTTFNDGVADGSLGAAAPFTKYTMNITLLQQAQCRAVLESLRANWMGVIVFNSGKYQYFVDKVRSASGLVFSDDPTSATRNMVGAPARHIKLTEESPGRVEIIFSNASKSWADDTAISELPEVAAGTYPKIIKRMECRGIDNLTQAQYVADVVRNQGQRKIQSTWRSIFEGIQASIMDRVTVASAIDGLTHDVLVTDIRQETSRFTFKGDIYSDSTYP